jgi:hypothetical protein
MRQRPNANIHSRTHVYLAWTRGAQDGAVSRYSRSHQQSFTIILRSAMLGTCFSRPKVSSITRRGVSIGPQLPILFPRLCNYGLGGWGTSPHHKSTFGPQQTYHPPQHEESIVVRLDNAPLSNPPAWATPTIRYSHDGYLHKQSL